MAIAGVQNNAGLIVTIAIAGISLGIFIGWILAQNNRQNNSKALVIDYNKEGRISAIVEK